MQIKSTIRATRPKVETPKEPPKKPLKESVIDFVSQNPIRSLLNVSDSLIGIPMALAPALAGNRVLGIGAGFTATLHGVSAVGNLFMAARTFGRLYHGTDAKRYLVRGLADSMSAVALHFAMKGAGPIAAPFLVAGATISTLAGLHIRD